MAQSKVEKKLSRSQLRRRQDIIQAAIKIFDRDGFDGARMIDIANEAEVAKGTLYLYFDNKIALVDGVIESVILPTLDVVKQVAKTQTQSASAIEILRQQIQISANRLASREMKVILKLMITGQSKNPNICKFYFDNVIGLGLKLFKNTIQLGVENGEFRKELAELDPVILVGSNVYFTVWKILFEDLSPLDLEKLIDQQIDLLLNGLIQK